MSHNLSDRIFHYANNTFILILSLTMIAPMIHLAAVSVSSPEYAQLKLVTFWPKGFQLNVYETLFSTKYMWQSMGVSIFITVVGTLLFLILTTSLSFAIIRPNMIGKRLIMKLILFSFIFPIPLIPSYLVVKELGMLNTLWSLIVPGALGAYLVFIVRAFFQGISTELYDAAKIDGSGEFGLFIKSSATIVKACSCSRIFISGSRCMELLFWRINLFAQQFIISVAA